MLNPPEAAMFKNIKTEIRSQDGTLHFRRWRLIETKYFRFYVHQIFQSDKDPHLHNHPWHFVSFIVKGRYAERRSNGVYKQFKGPLGINFHRAKTYHKITLLSKQAVSLFFAFGKYRPWGYQVLEEGHIPHDLYRERKHLGTLPKRLIP